MDKQAPQGGGCLCSLCKPGSYVTILQARGQILSITMSVSLTSGSRWNQTDTVSRGWFIPLSNLRFE